MPEVNVPFRYSIALLAAGFFVAGCGSPESGQEATMRRPVIELPKHVEPPTSMEPTKLVLFRTIEKPADLEPVEKLEIGDSPDDVEKMFPPPPGAFIFKELPTSFDKDYRARGYEGNKEGFGAIYYQDRLALAMLRLENVEPDVASSAVARYEVENKEGVKASSVTGQKGTIQYWFWEVDGQRLMICSALDAQNPRLRDLTIVLGDQNPMNALRMGEPWAINDRAAIEKLSGKGSRRG